MYKHEKSGYQNQITAWFFGDSPVAHLYLVNL